MSKARHGEKSKNYTQDEIKVIIKKYMTLIDDNAMLKLMYEHYTFNEIKDDAVNPYFETAEGQIKQLEDLIDVIYNAQSGIKDVEELKKKALNLRKEIIKYMEFITSYADRFSIYEYIFNRIEYKFEEHEKLKEDEVVKRIIEYIFESDDNMIVNTRLLQIIGQLPVRMTRNHLCDIVRDSCQVYNGSDMTSFKAFIATLEETAGINSINYIPDGFENFGLELADFEALSFDEMSEDKFKSMQIRLSNVTGRLVDLSDLYSMLMSMVNSVYINLLCYPYIEEHELTDPAVITIRALYSLYNDVDSDVWDKFIDSEENTLDALNGYFMDTEGRQESNSMQTQMIYSTVDRLVNSQKEDIKSIYEAQSNDITDVLERLLKLSGSSSFMELEEAEQSIEMPESEKADKDFIRHEADKFAVALGDKLKNSDRTTRRAIMAAIMERLPIFFKDAQQIAEYIKDAISYCDNDAEKQACMNIILLLMED